MKPLEFTANEVVEALNLYCKDKRITEIISVEVESIDNQHHPKRHCVGFGGVLTIRCDYYDLKRKP